MYSFGTNCLVCLMKLFKDQVEAIPREVQRQKEIQIALSFSGGKVFVNDQFKHLP